MKRVNNILAAVSLAGLTVFATGRAQTAEKHDSGEQPTLYVVGYSHLDTEWRWEYPQVINEYIRKTMEENFPLFEKYPHYIFNFSGANRYRFMKEYFPADFAQVKKYVNAGRWFPAGSSVEEGDVNNPNAEGIIRQVLYGNEWFRREFGKASAEYMLPDCFGFPSSLPTILAHSGVRGFSTQKLTWGSSTDAGGPESLEQSPNGVPFNVGEWVGPDGESVLAALNPGNYVGRIETDLSKPLPAAPPDEQRIQDDWAARVLRNGKVSGVYKEYHYYGTGDIGGAPAEDSVKLLEAIVTQGMNSLPPMSEIHSHDRARQDNPKVNDNVRQDWPEVKVGDGPVRVISSNADQMFLDITPQAAAGLPRYTGELELTNHSAGSLTSQAYQKRWIRKQELLADAAEKASVGAHWLGSRSYPLERLNNAWMLAMGAHFHDTAAGTSTPKAYEFAWNDDIIALNQFAGVLSSATQAVASALDTQGQGVAVVVFNPLNIVREEVVEASLKFPGGTPSSVHVSGPDGRQIPAQLSGDKVLFVASVPSTGYAVFHVQPGAGAAFADSPLTVSENSLENQYYRVSINREGDVASIFDKLANRELLAGPSRLAISYDNPKEWPAWNMDWDQEQAAPKAYVGGQARLRVVESGPARVAVEVTRQTADSNFVQIIRLSAGDGGKRLEFANAIDWRTKEANLKAVFPLAAKNQMATYNWDIGTIERPSAQPKKFEVPSHQWIDLTDMSGAFGATVLTDCKNGSDKPNDNTIRLTLIRTPGIHDSRGYNDQGTQDFGHHEILYGIAAHNGDWRSAGTDWQGQRLNDPLIAFQTSQHPGPLGREFSLLKVSNSRIRVLALKKAEQSDEIIVRLVELDGKPQTDVHVSFAAPIATAREVNGQEQPVGPATVVRGALTTSFTAYQPRTFAVSLAAPAFRQARVQSAPVMLPYDLAVASNDGARSAQGFDSKGNTIAAEMLPTEITFNDVRFHLASAKTGVPNALIAKRQTINLPAGRYNRVYLLAAAAEGDQIGEFAVGETRVALNIQDWSGFIGQWDNRQWVGKDKYLPGQPAQTVHDDYAEMVGIKPGFIKRAELAWYCSHHHNATAENVPYAYSYLFAYPIALPSGAKTITLPDNRNIRILAISVAEEDPEVIAAQPLYDVLPASEPNLEFASGKLAK